MKIFDIFRPKCQKQKNITKNSNNPGVQTVADYLNYINNWLDIGLKDSRSFEGRMVDLTDDCSRLILKEATEYQNSVLLTVGSV